MKIQYFGDINDFHKYRLLRHLGAEFKIGVCWMITPKEGNADGENRAYLGNPSRWAPFAPEVFHAIGKTLNSVEHRNSLEPFQSSCPPPIPNAFYSEDCSEETRIPLDNADRREEYLRRTVHKFKRASVDIVFFDPDNGVEPESGRPALGQPNSGKFIYWSEIQSAFNEGFSLLVYQHGTRENRERHIGRLVRGASTKIPNARFWVIRTPYVFFLLIAQPGHRERLDNCFCQSTELGWMGEFRLASEGSPLSEHFTFGKVALIDRNLTAESPSVPIDPVSILDRSLHTLVDQVIREPTSNEPPDTSS